MTLLAVVAVGYIITQSLDSDRVQRADIESNKQKREEKRIIYRELLSDYLTTYNSAKRIRRNLRNNYFQERYMKNRKPYHDQMQAFIDVQLQFEYLKKLVENSDVFLEARDLALYLDSIESYLNKIIREYRDNYKSLSENDEYELNELPRLNDFITKAKDSKNFIPKFKEAGDQGLAAMLKLLTEDKVKIEESHAVETLIKDLENNDSGVRVRAVEALEKSRDNKGVNPLIIALGDKSGYVRLRAIKALEELYEAKIISKFDEAKIVGKLANLLSNKNEYDIVSKEAEDFLEKICPNKKHYFE